MAKAFKCDRCGIYSETGFSTLTIQQADSYTNRDEYDLCENCTTDVKAVIEGEPEPEPGNGE